MQALLEKRVVVQDSIVNLKVLILSYQAAHLARHSRDAKPAAHQEQRLFPLPGEGSRRRSRELHRATRGSRDTRHPERSLPLAVSKTLQQKAICQSTTVVERDTSRETADHPGDPLQMRQDSLRQYHNRGFQSSFASSEKSHLGLPCRSVDVVPS